MTAPEPPYLGVYGAPGARYTAEEVERFPVDNLAEPVFGIQIGPYTMAVHPRRICYGRDIPCVIHSPSDHHMRSWPLNWRSDTGVMERVCEHECGHPDPDHMAYVRSLTPEHDCPNEGTWPEDEEACPYPHLEWQGEHGCDGCC